MEQKFTSCSICGKGLGVEKETPIYCSTCIEEMCRLGIGIEDFKKVKAAQARGR